MPQISHNSIQGTTAVKIVQSIEAAVRSGQLRAGDALPPVRALAGDLGVSPATVASAYQTLQSRGVLIAEGRRGTRVTHRQVIQPSSVAAPLPKGVRNLRDGNPDAALLPDMAPALREIDASPRLYGAARNDSDLIRMASDDFAADGIPPAPITVVNGALDGIERVLREQLRPGDRVAIEDPGYGSMVDLIASMGFSPVPVEIDDEGPIPAELVRALKSRVHGLIITPRAQNPTGAAITAARAAEIRRILQNHGSETLVIEDDHASVITDAPAVTVITPRLARWAVVRSMSKALNPDLRVALLTGDQHTMSRVEDRLVVGERWVSHILQRLVVRLLSDRSVQKHLAGVTRTYAQRRLALIDALARHGLHARGRSGFNVWINVAQETPTVQGMMQLGWAVSAGERFRMKSSPAIRITTSTLLPEEARRVAADLATVLRPRVRTAAA